MENKPKHKALVVGHREKVAGFLSSDTLPVDLELTFCQSAEEALSVLDQSTGAFALVVSDQKLPGMAGTDLLARAKEAAPDTVRLLMTRYSEMALIMRSVNTGVVDRYILKKKGAQGAAEEIAVAIQQYEMQIQTRTALAEAKKLNRRLHQLDTELIDSTKSLDQAHQETDRKIAALELQIQEISQTLEKTAAPSDQALTDFIEGAAPEGLDRLYARTVAAIFTQFEEIAKRNGFQMPLPGQVETNDTGFTAQSLDD